MAGTDEYGVPRGLVGVVFLVLDRREGLVGRSMRAFVIESHFPSGYTKSQTFAGCRVKVREFLRQLLSFCEV